MLTALLIVHGLLAVALLGAITHQALAVADRPKTPRAFTQRFRGVDPAGYATAVIVLFGVTSAMGAVLYPEYRVMVRPFLEARNLRAANGIFEVKEHFAALGLGMLPAYWAVWKHPLEANYGLARRGLTWFFAGIIWWNFLTGHVLTNIHGLFS